MFRRTARQSGSEEKTEVLVLREDGEEIKVNFEKNNKIPYSLMSSILLIVTSLFFVCNTMEDENKLLLLLNLNYEINV